jgi:NADPH2:quinone reductase
VKIIAAPINPSDLAFIDGGYQSAKKLPTTPGFEGAGVVVESGGGLMGWSMVGKNVAISVQGGSTGTYGQYAIVNVMEAMTLPNVSIYVNSGNHAGAGVDEFR